MSFAARRINGGHAAGLLARGVSFEEGWAFDKLIGANGIAERAVAKDGRELPSDQFVFATGALSPFLSDALGCRIPIEPGKGYSITTNRPERCPRIPMIFEAHRVAVTPFDNGYRLGSTMEFAGYDTSIDPKRIRLLEEGASHYLFETRGETVQEQWFGWRPMTWDGKPLIGASPRWSNAYLAAGHNMLGLSMAPATGRLIRECIRGERPHVEPKRLIHAALADYAAHSH